MKYTFYDKYIDSNVDWIGYIPFHWRVKRLKFLIEKGLQYGANEAAELDDRELPRYIRITDIDENGNLRENTFRSLPEEIAVNYLLKEGDILFARSGATVGKTFLYRNSWGTCAYAGYLIKASLKKLSVNPDFISYCTKSQGYASWISSMLIQATIQNVSAEKYASFIFPFPSLNEQISIAAFLDRETTRIDALIEKKKKLIELLKEKRTALITRAVTKGLNKEIKMKPSGIEWLGEIPEHWEVKRLKEVSTINDDVLPENTDPEYQVCYVDIGNVDKNDGIIGKEEFVFGNAPSRARRVVKDGDVIVSTVRTYLRAIAPIVDPKDNLIVSTGFAVVRPKLIDKGYLSFSLRSFYFINRVVSFSTGVSYPAITSTILAKIKIPIPPSLNEQAEISNYLNLKIEGFNNIEKKVQNLISKLQEYRTALISAAVTGKIRVGEGGKIS